MVLLEKNVINVLDCFHANGTLWSEISKRNFDTKIQVTGIEKDKTKTSSPYFVLYGDNERMLPKMDLSQYHIIDCDAYGDSTKAIQCIVKNPTLQNKVAIILTV